MVSADVVNVAIPAALTVPVPRIVEPSRNVTVPVAPAVMLAVKVIDWFAAEGFAEDTNVTVGAVLATVTVVAGEVAEKLVGPSGTDAVIGFAPNGSEVTVNVATPSTIVAVPRTVPLSKNVTGPGTPDGTGSVIVTGLLGVGFVLETVGAGSTGVVFVTVTVVAGEVAGLLLESPGVLAVIGSLPTGRLLTVIVATPPTTGAVPIGVDPFENVTGPVTPVGTVSVIVTVEPYVVVVGETTGAGSEGDALSTFCVSGEDVAVL
jgi:hypothetical protein